MTILGANQGIDGTGVRGAESIIEGTVTVTQATDNVAFDGVQVNNTSDNLTQFKGIVVSGGADVTVENSWFHSTGPNGNNVNGDRGIELQSGATGTILIDGNLFGGVQDGAGNRFSTANWTTGVWSDGNSVGLTITGNTFYFVRTGLNLDGYNDATTNVSLNSFVESGSGISIGTPSGSVVTGIHNNTFDGVGSGFNLLNVATSQSLDLNATNNVSVSPTDAMVVLGGTASDTLTGSDGVDSLAGGAGADNLTGGAVPTTWPAERVPTTWPAVPTRISSSITNAPTPARPWTGSRMSSPGSRSATTTPSCLPPTSSTGSRSRSLSTSWTAGM